MAAPEQWSLRSALADVLDDVGDPDLERFKFHVRDEVLFRDFAVIRRHRLESTDRPKILTAILDHYGIFTVDIVKTALEQMDEYALRDELSRRCPYKPEEVLARCEEKMASALRELFRFLAEGGGGHVEFNEAYTKLFVIVGGSGQVCEEHEVTQMERDSRRSGQETSVLCQDLFKDQRGKPIRVVLTKGVAGVGKTVLTQKFSLDWAERKTNLDTEDNLETEDRANQDKGRASLDAQLLFHLSFRDLNELKDQEFSLVELLHECFEETRELFSFQQLKLLFILDGLDEYKLTLDFRSTRVITDPTESASVEELLVNLIRGNLLPSSHFWITTRPAAANQIPERFVSRVTEVRGFTDQQKDEFFMKKFKDKATGVIRHIKKSRSLYVMCHIAVFCSILSNVLLHLMETINTVELPSTLTQIYIHFLLVQAEVQKQRCEEPEGPGDPWTPEIVNMVWSLGKLAFEKVLEGKLIFSKADLSKHGLDTEDVARYSVFKEILKAERGRRRVRVYCFIHRSLQEFLAALHVHRAFFSSGVNLMSPQQPSSESAGSPPAWSLKKSLFQMFRAKDSPEFFYRCAVDQALRSPNGHLDLFLRFLLGLSLPTNQELLSDDLIPRTGSHSTNRETARYIREKLDGGELSAERSLNLLHCLNELNDRSLLEEVQKVLRGEEEEELSHRNMSPADLSAVSFLLLSSDSDLEEFDLRRYRRSDRALLALLPVLQVSTKATLSSCFLTENICAPLASALGSSSGLKHLDLSNNDLGDSGVEQLCEGLKSSAPCRLETLRLSGCLLSERGGASLAAALGPAHSALTELDLSYNHLGPSADLLKNHLGPSADLLKNQQEPPGRLQTLRLDPGGRRFLVPGLRKYACEVLLDPNTAHRVLRVSEDLRSVTHWEEWPCPDHPDRFSDYTFQVLGSSGLRGRCYWEVDWTVRQAPGFLAVAVSSRRIPRRGEESRFGQNDLSWSLSINEEGRCFVAHGNEQTILRGGGARSLGLAGRVSDLVGVFSGQGVSSSVLGVAVGAVGVLFGRKGRVGVYLDREGGALSFYDVTDGERSHLHTFNAAFTEDLLPGFRLGFGSTVSVVDLDQD